MKFLVTGGSGFIGTNLVEAILMNGDEVLNIDIKSPQEEKHFSHWQKLDILDLKALAEAIALYNPEVIFHLAARTDLNGHSINDYNVNTLGVDNLLKSICKLSSLKIVIFASSRLVCEIGYTPITDTDFRPTTPYGESKVFGENLVQSAGGQIPCAWTIVRPTSIWGPWFDIPYKTFFLSIQHGRYIHPGAMKIDKSFGFVGNTVYQLLSISRANRKDVDGKVLYLADSNPIDVLDFANTIQKKMCAPKIKSINIHYLRFAAFVGDALKLCGWKNVPLTSFRLKNLITPMVYDLSPLEKIAGELPYSVEDGVHITLKWMNRS